MTEAPGGAAHVTPLSRAVQIVLRLTLAGIFIYAAIPKLLHPDQFAESLLDYALLPVQWTNLVALWLPAFELIVGLAVLLGLWVRAGALAMAGMGVIFLGALAWVQSGPTPLPCSCFSTDPGSDTRTWWSLWQEVVLVLLACALWVSHWPHTVDPLPHLRRRQILGMVTGVLIVLLVVAGVLVARHQSFERANAQAQRETAAAATAPLPRLLDLGAASCEACQHMAPVVEELKSELLGKVNVQFVDVSKAPHYAQQYDLVAIPTQIIFDATGHQIGRHEGTLTKAEALALLRKLGISVD